MSPSATASRKPDPQLALHRTVVVHSIPIAMAAAGLLIVTASIINLVANDSPLWSTVSSLAVGVFSLGCGLVLHRGRFAGITMSWLWSAIVGAYFLQASMLVFQKGNAISLGFITVALIMLGPVALEWRPTLVVGIPCIVLPSVAGIISSGIQSSPWLLTLATSFLMG